jgi:hypothetical protein
MFLNFLYGKPKTEAKNIIFFNNLCGEDIPLKDFADLG